MTTFHYIMSPLEKSFFLHPSNAVRMWGIKRVFVARRFFLATSSCCG